MRPEWLAGAAAAALDSSTGLFRLRYPTSPLVRLQSADSIARAVAIYLAHPDPFGILVGGLEKDRGAPVDIAALQLCERPVYVPAPFANFPPEIPGVIRRAWGAQWAVPLCGNDDAVQVSVGVPDNPRDISLDADTLVFTRTEGGGYHFTATGVPARFPAGLPVTPEKAVESIFLLTGLRIVEVPVAFDQQDERGLGQLPLCASWRIRVEAPVEVPCTLPRRCSRPPTRSNSRPIP